MAPAAQVGSIHETCIGAGGRFARFRRRFINMAAKKIILTSLAAAP